jgi:hypothetical protein
MLDQYLDIAFDDLRRLCRQPDDAPKEQSARKKVKKTKEEASPKKTKRWQDGFSPLVGELLCYRVVNTAHDRKPFDSSSPQMKAAEATFVAAFQETWNHLPVFDQCRLLAYWQHPAHRFRPDADEYPRPLIQIIVGAWTPNYCACDRLGYELNFPLAWISCPADWLRYEIARALAIIHRCATRVHWRLAYSMIEEPLARWEKRQGKITEAALEKKHDSLEKKYLKVYEEQVAEQLRGWGIEKPVGESGNQERCSAT